MKYFEKQALSPALLDRAAAGAGIKYMGSGSMRKLKQATNFSSAFSKANNSADLSQEFATKLVNTRKNGLQASRNNALNNIGSPPKTDPRDTLTNMKYGTNTGTKAEGFFDNPANIAIAGMAATAPVVAGVSSNRKKKRD